MIDRRRVNHNFTFDQVYRLHTSNKLPCQLLKTLFVTNEVLTITATFHQILGTPFKRRIS